MSGCGHCKSTKPEFVKAAEEFADELMVAFGAVDCTAEKDLCATYNVSGYPTIKYFSYFDRQIKDYTSGRKVSILSVCMLLFLSFVMLWNAVQGHGTSFFISLFNAMCIESSEI